MKASSCMLLACGTAATGAFELPQLGNLLSNSLQNAVHKVESAIGRTADGVTKLAGISFQAKEAKPADAQQSEGAGNATAADDRSCPNAWFSISQELTRMFLSNGQCNDAARAAIRATFHDCGTWSRSQGNSGGCDGSLILAGESSRAENNGLQNIISTLGNLAQRYRVGYADMLVFAGNAATVICPGGPTIRTWVGRRDSNRAAPQGMLPSPRSDGETIYRLFQDKGFNARDLAALIGAHTCSRQRFVDTSQAGRPQDSTPGIWDVRYYGETVQNPPPSGNFRFPSDSNLAQHVIVGPEFSGFVNNQGKWGSSYASAMERMTLLGVPGGASQLIDCTRALPRGTNNKRDMRALNPFAPRN